LCRERISGIRKNMVNTFQNTTKISDDDEAQKCNPSKYCKRNLRGGAKRNWSLETFSAIHFFEENLLRNL